MVGEPLPNLKDLTDRDILILTVQRVNSICLECARHNEVEEKQDRRLDSLELFKAGAMACVGVVLSGGGLLIALGKLVWK